MNYYNRTIDDILKELGTSRQGIPAREAEERLARDGANELREMNQRPAWRLFLNQFRNFMILVLIAAAIVSGITGDTTDMVIILVIVILNAILGFVQEYRADKAMNALKKMAAPESRVIRNGKTQTLPAANIVKGDVVVLEAGNSVPADVRLIETHALKVDESALTGESVSVDKNVDPVEGEDISPGDQVNMAFKGTLITNGRGLGVVTATGMNTEIGSIARMLQENESSTPLQKRMEDFGKKISWIILGICVLLFVTGILRGESPVSMLMISISLAVAAIPEALPALITICLARGASRLVKKKALIRKLPAVETLGSVTYICTDKTGTLTMNKMTVTGTYPATDEEAYGFNILEASMALNHDVKRNDEGKLIGDATEVALVNYFIEQHGDEAYRNIRNEAKRRMEIPFDSDRKCMTTVHNYNNRFLVITKGAAEAIAPLLVEQPGNLKQDIIRHASEGLRVLAFGYRFMDNLPESEDPGLVETELQFAGITTMIDPPREEARQAVKECRQAGINVVMITGDHKETAAAIATELGILEKQHAVVNGTGLKNMTDEELSEKVEGIRVYARVSPAQKLSIVKSLQDRGHYVAMTGDGVNDAPSLKASNIGVAMGINGTDVSKQSAHMILLDDNFATIVKAVREGRRIFDNIRKFVKYIMTCNSAEIWTISIAPILGMPIPLLPIHILWINLVTDGLPGLTLAGEKAEKNVMKRPPRDPKEGLFAGGIGFHILWVGILMAVITLFTQWYAMRDANAHWQTMVFAVLSISQLGHVLAIRSEHDSLYRQGLLSNLPLSVAILFTFLLQLAVIYVPFLNTVFHTQPLSLEELGICILLSAIVFHAVEFEKFLKRRKRSKSYRRNT